MFALIVLNLVKMCSSFSVGIHIINRLGCSYYKLC